MTMTLPPTIEYLHEDKEDDENRLVCRFTNTTAQTCNEIRRILLADLPVLGFDVVEVYVMQGKKIRKTAVFRYMKIHQSFKPKCYNIVFGPYHS
jgi:hypothetical protein